MEKGKTAKGTPANAPYWSCSTCHYVLQSLQPPDVCPSCGQACQFVDVSCYIPECGFNGVDSRLINKERRGL
ncbi:MAG: rubredoxin-like domain-containing protein [bacterium]